MDFLLLPLLSVCLLSCSGTTSGATVVRVTEGSEAVLPCFIRPEQNITQDHFEWKKDGQKVFFYVRGKHHNNVLPGQDEQFKGRVSHFQDQLQFSNASIVIRDTKRSDSGTYTCDYSPDDFDRQTFNIELDVVAVVRVREGSEAVLPCLIRPERDITQHLFDWKKDVNQEVFLYNKGSHYNNGLTGQDEQFKGRVSHFPEELQSGNASIRIHNTKLSDRGTYTCDFPLLQPKGQTYNIELVVAACPEPIIITHKATEHLALLQCDVRGAFPKPTVEWQDSTRKKITAKEPQVTERENRFYITLNTTVTKTGDFYCVATQMEFCNQLSTKTYIPGPELITDCILRDRSEENIPGASLRPYITTLKGTRDKAQLQCEVQRVSPKPEVKWQDSDGNILPAEEPQVTERGGSYDIILKTTVTKTDNYRCVVTQEEICHQISDETSVYIYGPELITVSGSWTGLVVGVVVLSIILLVVLLLVLYDKRQKIRNLIKGPQAETERDEEKNSSESVKLKNTSTSEPQ